jgi:MFS family permease
MVHGPAGGPIRRWGGPQIATLRRITVLTALLLGVDFLDELWSGVPSVGAPGIQASFGLSYTRVAGILLVAPGLLSLLIEPPLFLLADRGSKRRFVLWGLLALGLCQFLAAAAGNAWVLLIALVLAAPLSGIGVNLSQAVLMDANPGERERYMTRWTFMGMAGDLAAPLLFFILAGFAAGWREAFVVSGLLLVGYSLLLSRQTFPERVAGPERGEDVPIRSALREALRNRAVLLWLGGVALCGLLDEILVAFGALYLRDALGADLATRSLILMLFSGGMGLGLFVTDRWLGRGSPMRILGISSAACIVFYLAWILAPSVWLSGLLMFGVGMFTAPLYPIAKAQVYRLLPGRSGMVNALSTVFTSVELAVPLLLGLIADRLGLAVAMCLLLLQPAGLLLLALRSPVGRPQAPA